MLLADRPAATTSAPAMRTVKRRARTKGLCIDAEAAELLDVEVGRHGPRRRRADGSREINFDGIVGPSHNYAGLSLGNLASTRNAGDVSQPRAAALQGLDKMRANLALGLAQGIFVPHAAARPRLAGRARHDDRGRPTPTLAANAMSASAMWAANAATVSPAPDTRGRQAAT